MPAMEMHNLLLILSPPPMGIPAVPTYILDEDGISFILQEDNITPIQAEQP
jgi:hypothetical protein